MNSPGLHKEDIDRGPLLDASLDYLLTVGEWAFKSLSSPRVAQWGVDPPSNTRKELKHIVGIIPDKTRDHVLNAAEQLFGETCDDTGRRGLIVVEGLSQDALPRLSHWFIDSALKEEWAANEPWRKWRLEEGEETIRIAKWTKQLLRHISWAEKAQFEVTKAMGIEPSIGKRLIPSRIWQVENKTFIEFENKHGIQGGSSVLKIQHVHPRLDGLHVVDQKISANALAIHGIPRIPELESSKREPAVSLCDAVISVEYMVDPSRVVYHILRVDSPIDSHAKLNHCDGTREVQQFRYGAHNTKTMSHDWADSGKHSSRRYPDGGQPWHEVTAVSSGHKANPGLQKQGYNSSNDRFNPANLDQGRKSTWDSSGSNENFPEDSVWGSFDAQQTYCEDKMVAARPSCEIPETRVADQIPDNCLVANMGIKLMDRFGSERMMGMLVEIAGPAEVSQWLSDHGASIRTGNYDGLQNSRATRASLGNPAKLLSSFLSNKKHKIMVEGALEAIGNSILCVPEGQRGVVVLELTRQYLQKHSRGKVLVLAQSARNGIMFLSKFEEEGFEESGYRANFFSSCQGTKLNRGNWGDSHRSLSVMIMAPQLLQNSILGEYGKFTDFGLIIMDECHQVTGSSSSKLLLMNYLNLPPHQRSNVKIIGLSSTDLKMLPGDAMQEMCRCMAVEMKNLKI